MHCINFTRRASGIQKQPSPRENSSCAFTQFSSFSNMPTSQPSVVIVGAGAAGIAAATRLLENGFENVTVLEAENRIGGRVHSMDFEGSVVDLGGTWVHGEQDNVVFDMVKKMDFLARSHNDYSDFTYYLSNGKVADKNITDHLQKIGMQILEDEDNAKKHPGPWGTYFSNEYKQRVQKEYSNNPEALELAGLVENWISKFFLCLDSAPTTNDISTSGMFVFDKCEGYQQWNWKNKGYRTIFYIMMKKIPDIAEQLPIDDKIFVNKEVTKIIWDKNELNKNGATVQCADGSSYNADHVILTPSVGVLQSFHKDLFSPPLPKSKVDSIEGIQLGTVNKIILKFPTKWWPDDLKGFSLLWTEEDRQNILKDFPHGPNVNGRSWLEDVFGFYVLDAHPRVLLGWMVGEMAAEMENLSDEVVTNGCMVLLQKFAGRKYQIPQPDGILRTKWKSNPHFRGSYVYPGIEQERRKVKAEDLAEPLTSGNGKQTLLFSGEATHPNRYSTVHGSIETGYREADRVIKLY